MRVALVLCAVVLASCAERVVQESAPPPDEAEAAAVTAETRDGPVTATVSLTPAEPRLGDSLVLTLAVVADAGVSVEMPVFGDALGRFSIVDYAPRRETTESGATAWTQRYTLQSPMSGRQRVPRLRIEYVDERGGQTDAEARELLTDELSFLVASVLPEGEVTGELRAPRTHLAALEGPWLGRYWPWLATAVVALGAGVAGFAFWLRGAEERARETAYDRALGRLQRLRSGGLPDVGAADEWYVELSDIVRRYIEERFALRAPELTTEEFLMAAGRSVDLSPLHGELLSDFLARCDRVKFARYSPAQDESRIALGVAERFLGETRHVSVPGSAADDAQTVPA